MDERSGILLILYRHDRLKQDQVSGIEGMSNRVGPAGMENFFLDKL